MATEDNAGRRGRDGQCDGGTDTPKRRERFLGVALKSGVVAAAGLVAVAMKYGYLPEPRASIWTPIGHAVGEAVPYAGELVVVIALLVFLVSMLLAFKRSGE